MTKTTEDYEMNGNEKSTATTYRSNPFAMIEMGDPKLDRKKWIVTVKKIIFETFLVWKCNSTHSIKNLHNFSILPLIVYFRISTSSKYIKYYFNQILLQTVVGIYILQVQFLHHGS